MVTNLVGNAPKYRRPGSAITVAMDRRGDRIFVSVTNEGEDVLAQELRVIFDRYYRAPRGHPAWTWHRSVRLQGARRGSWMSNLGRVE
ncbi:MAG: ATP-binding protein [Polyangiaceae bacterium]